MKNRILLGLVASVVCAQVAAQGTVSYETMAKPLPAILNDVGAMLHKKIVCSKSMESDLLFIKVTDVDPDELLDKIRSAVGGRFVDEAAFLLLEPDPEFDSKFLKRRNALIDDWHAKWKESLQSTVRVSRADMDLSALAEFVTPDRLKSLGIEEYVWFARPRKYKTALLPSSVPDYHKLVTSTRYNYVGTGVSIQSTRNRISIRLIFEADDKRSYGVHSKYISMSVATEGQELFSSIRHFPDGTLGERLSLANTLRTSASYGRNSARLLSDLELFNPKYWGSEPLNAFAVPYLNSLITEFGQDIVAYLDDEAAIPNIVQSLYGSSFLSRNFIYQDGDWIVAQSKDPSGARKRRADRGGLADFLRRVERNGYVDFWSYVDYIRRPRTFSESVMRVESAALGLLPFVCMSSMQGVKDAGLYRSLMQDASTWPLLLSGESVPISSLSPQSRSALEQYVQSRVVFNVDVDTSVMFNGILQGRSERRKMDVLELGVGTRFPRDATIHVQVTRNNYLLGKNSERDYALSTRLSGLANAIAYSEAGLGNINRDSLHALNSFVPYDDVSMYIRLKVGKTGFDGPHIRYVDFNYGVNWRSIGELPQPMLEEFNKRLATARKSAKQQAKKGGGGK